MTMKNVLQIFTLTLIFFAVPTAAYELGDVVEDFTLTDLEGQEVSLSDHAGQIIMLNFFATWCAGCNVEAEHLENDIWQVYADQGVMVIAIDIQEQLSLVQGWAAAMGVTYPIWMAPDWSLFLTFPDAISIPYNAILDQDLVIRYATLGFDLNEITNMIEVLLEEGEVAVEGSSLGGVKARYR